MHIHDQSVAWSASTPWLLVAVLACCLAFSAMRVFSHRGSDDDAAHLLMNGTMVAMLLDASMSLGHWWITVTLTVAAVLAARCAWRPTLSNGVHVFAALLMVAATALMLLGAAGSLPALVLAGVVAVDLCATVVLAVAGRVATAPGGMTVELASARAQTLPHIGMGIGMVAMLVGA